MPISMTYLYSATCWTLNNLFVFSNMLDDHKKHLEYVFQKLCEHHLFLEKAKCDLYSESMDCLGHLVDDCSLHIDTNKMAQIQD
jgi:hypothetical protein